MRNPYLFMGAEACLIALEFLHVVVGERVDVPDFFWRELPHDLAGRADHERAIRNFLALGDEGIGADQAVAADFRAVEYHALDADQAAVTDGAAVQHRHVPNADPLAQRYRQTGIRMHDAAVLQLGIFADGDRVVVAAHDAAEPDAGVKAHHNRADHDGIGRDPVVAMTDDLAVFERVF